MDYDKLIHCLKCCARVDAQNEGCDDCDLEYCGEECQQLCGTAATALSTLQAENEKLRAELEQMAACVYYKDGGLCQCGGDDPANVCVMGPCPHEISVFDLTQLIHHVRLRLEDVKAERDAIEQDFRAFTKQWWEQDSGFPCRWCKFENSGGCEWKAKQPNEEKICAGRAFEWRGQKEG